MTDDVPQDVVQVTDFHFHTCRKFRIFDAKSGITMGNSSSIRNQLATSSQLGVTLAVVSANQMVCFPTKSLLSFKMSRENMNVEVTELPMKTLTLAGVVQINDIGVNSDGTLLAVLHTNKNDVSADVFEIRKLCSHGDSNPIKPLCKTRVGLDDGNHGTALEWNPAFPDTFAAASSDRSVLVVKVDVQNPSSQSLVGIGKLGAHTTTISWSPKGKQLTVGDSLGKIVQLKPSLEVVRSQFGPKEYGNVTGLCWLATTEWLVAFEKAPGEQDTYLMRCKKDKPTEWIQLHELSYSSSKWPLRPQLFTSPELLVDWNVVVVGNSKTSEVAVVGKREDWQTWVPVEGEGIYLPTTSDGKDTVPIGVAIDRTMTEEVSLKPDGSQKHRPSPLVLCLTNDGVLTAHHVVSTFDQHKPCQIESQNFAINGLSAAPTAQKSSAFTPFGALPTAKPSTIFEQKIETPTKAPAAAPAPAPSNLFGKPTAPAPSNLFGKPAAPAQAPAPTLAQTPAPSNLFGKPSTPAPAPAQAPPPKTPEKVAAPSTPTEKTPAPEVDKKAEQLALKKKMLIEQIEKVSGARKLSREAVMKMSMSVTNTKTAVSECSDVVKCSLEDSKEVMEELKNVLSSIEWMEERTKHAVKEMDFEIEEKMQLVADVADSGDKILEKLRDMSETERLMRFNKLETSADMLNGKFAECSTSIKKLKAALIEKEAQRKQTVLSPLRQNGERLRMGAETEVALKVMRNVSKIIMDTRERIQRTELELALFKREKPSIQKKTSTFTSSSAPNNHNISILDAEPRSHELSDSEALKARGALVARLQKRGVVKTKTIHVETYQKEHFLAPKPVEMDTTSLSNAILKLSMTPRRVTSSKLPATPSSSRRDATTQADEPPVVKTVVVTVESPAKPIQTPPTTSLPKTSAVTTTTSTSPLKPSGIFGKSTTSSLVTPPTPTFTPKTSILKPETPEKTPEATETEKAPELPIEEIQKTPEAPKPKEEPKIESTPAPTTPVKNEPAPAPAPPPEQQKTPVKEEQKTPAPAAAPELTSTPKTPSFSFSNAAASKPATSSIFGGGLNTTSSPSNLFGPKTTPPSNSSIFGGGAKPATTSSPFGSFGQTSTPATTTAATTTPAVSFSFNTAAQPAKPSFGAFGAAAPAKSAVFGASLNNAPPSVPNVDDGMEDDSMVSGGGPGGFMSGLGGSASSGANPFAPKPASNTTSSSSWLFSGGGANQQQQKPSFSFNQPAATPAPSASSSFGAAPKFGSQPVFGAKPFGGGATSGGGGLSKNASIFGGAAGGAGGFAQFAGQKTSSMFGGGAAAPAQSSIFGGGAAQQSAPSSSIFGGGAGNSGASANKSGSFTSWR